jgi:diguanylate cyclase (GGDEF)-like protein/PAS domain S-box-containing protein
VNGLATDCGIRPCPSSLKVTPAGADNGGMRGNGRRGGEHVRIAECRDELELKSLLLDAIVDAVIVHTLDGELVYFNEAAATMQGYTRVEFAMLGTWGWMSPEWRPKVGEAMQSLSREKWLAPFEAKKVRKDGAIICTEIHPSTVTVGGRELCVAVIRDITARIQAEEQVRHLAFHDALTGLANRSLLERRLEEAIEASNRTGVFGLVYIDLDDFKPINDRFGHDVGDRVLQVVAKRIRAHVREGDTVARLGGDEFGVLATRLPDLDALGTVARQLGHAIGERMSVEGVELTITASTGCAVWQPGVTPAELLKRADLDMYDEKLCHPPDAVVSAPATPTAPSRSRRPRGGTPPTS